MKEKIIEILDISISAIQLVNDDDPIELYGFDSAADAIMKLINQEVEKRIAEIDKYGRLSIAVIKKKLWSMRFDEDDVKNETDNERKQYIYGYTEAINHMVEYLMDMASLCNCSRMTSSEKPNNSEQQMWRDIQENER